MDYNTIDISKWENVFSGDSFWLARSLLGDYWVVTVDQRAVSNLIAFEISNKEAGQILESGGDREIVDQITRNKPFAFAKGSPKKNQSNSHQHVK